MGMEDSQCFVEDSLEGLIIIFFFAKDFGSEIAMIQGVAVTASFIGLLIESSTTF
ncbi:hypothetical protein RBWH47_05882 [Rhodopirellula baltica WH47]|uniref:Uncharacterized protein n=1 Tax=Rhodopirellula baltica WH47 TaxID=991778 RepID=F2AW58_RHOBT|nr:hypothetical protein RBWH47_05882 [Rhodopirellula baltica WH47]